MLADLDDAADIEKRMMHLIEHRDGAFVNYISACWDIHLAFLSHPQYMPGRILGIQELDEIDHISNFI